MWEIITPFGGPVVPLVKQIVAQVVGEITGYGHKGMSQPFSSKSEYLKQSILWGFNDSIVSGLVSSKKTILLSLWRFEAFESSFAIDSEQNRVVIPVCRIMESLSSSVRTSILNKLYFTLGPTLYYTCYSLLPQFTIIIWNGSKYRLTSICGQGGHQPQLVDPYIGLPYQQSSPSFVLPYK